MTDEAFVLLLLVIVMLVGSYMAGSIPLVMKLSEEKLNFITVLGAGLLVGTALTVIIPEGIRSLYMEDFAQLAHDAVALNAAGSSSNGVVAAVGEAQGNALLLSSSDSARHLNAEHSEGAPAHVHRAPTGDHTRTIGLSLVLGFIFMMLVDHLSKQRSATPTAKSEKNITATLGLVVHAAADGVALGAAATTSHQDVEMIVFLAIMLHKAPAAFGLVSFLLHEKIERQQIRKHLLIFSLSAPLLTLLTYFGIGQEQKETLNSVNATGIAMLFSAGTFLYVATVHVLPELTQRGGAGGGAHHHGHHQPRSTQKDYDGYKYAPLAEESGGGTPGAGLTSIEVSTVQAASGAPNGGLRWSELVTLMCGALLPLVITFGHSH